LKTTGQINRGFNLTVGFLVLSAAIVLFSFIASDVAPGTTLTLIDARINVWLHTHNTALLTTVFLLISRLHSQLGIAIMTLAICIYLWSRHQCYWVLTILLAVFGGMLLNVLLKNLFTRQRPDPNSPILLLKTFSFPSGHTMLAVVFYGTLAALAVSRLRDGKSRVLAIVTAILMIALVGFSRIYLGVHYLSDVLGAIVEGLGWLALCLLSVDMIRHWQDGH
jgi:undecaprenyl-diphosphatase